jgi:phospholipid-transporting ATPase
VIQVESKGKSHKIATSQELADEYMLILSLAHECVVETDKNGDFKYQGPSPDEITLVEASKNMGYFYKRSDNQYAYL